MSLVDKVVTGASLLASAAATAGSLLIHHDQETGRDTLNVGPAVCWFYGLSVIGCSLSHGEPFSQCVKSVFSVLGG